MVLLLVNLSIPHQVRPSRTQQKYQVEISLVPQHHTIMLQGEVHLSAQDNKLPQMDHRWAVPWDVLHKFYICGGMISRTAFRVKQVNPVFRNTNYMLLLQEI